MKFKKISELRLLYKVPVAPLKTSLLTRGIRTYPNHVPGTIYARIELESLNPYCKGKTLASQQKISK